MSRWIVQLAVSGTDRIVALDNNGIAWRLTEHWDSRGTITSSTWERLPALPSIDNLAPKSAAIAEPSPITAE